MWTKVVSPLRSKSNRGEGDPRSDCNSVSYKLACTRGLYGLKLSVRSDRGVRFGNGNGGGIL